MSLKALFHRSPEIPPLPEIERFGADGEEAVYRLLCEHFDCVLRNVAVPRGKLFLEKDFLVSVGGVPFVLEVKNWKGEIGCAGSSFYQNKPNGVRKELKSPVGTTNQFIHCMKQFYKLSRPVYGVVVFCEPDCSLSLPEEMDGVALLPLSKLVSHLKSVAKKESRGFDPIDPDRLLRCTRFYGDEGEFTKGILADNFIECTAEDGSLVRLDTTRLRYLSTESQPLRRRIKLYVTFSGNSTAVFYLRDLALSVACLDGSYRTLSLSHIRHIVF